MAPVGGDYREETGEREHDPGNAGARSAGTRREPVDRECEPCDQQANKRELGDPDAAVRG